MCPYMWLKGICTKGLDRESTNTCHIPYSIVHLNSTWLADRFYSGKAEEKKCFVFVCQNTSVFVVQWVVIIFNHHYLSAVDKNEICFCYCLKGGVMEFLIVWSGYEMSKSVIVSFLTIHDDHESGCFSSILNDFFTLSFNLNISKVTLESHVMNFRCIRNKTQEK